MGDGTTFGRRFKGHKGVPRFHIENFLYVKDWTIENMDFRVLMKKYNKPRVFYYLDPPYISSGKKYKHSFKLQDLIDLKKAMDEHQGSYLLNLSFYDEGMEDIFGKPNRTIGLCQSTDRERKEEMAVRVLVEVLVIAVNQIFLSMASIPYLVQKSLTSCGIFQATR